MNLETRARHAAQGIHESVEVMRMSTPTDELRPGSVERMDHYKNRQDRNRRIGALVVALVLAGGVVATALAVYGRNEPVPANPPITTGNVGDLQVQWTGAMGAKAPPPVVADGVVVDATADGQVVAFGDRCAAAGAACSPLWTATIEPYTSFADQSDGTITWWPTSTGAPGEAENVAAFAAAGDKVYTVSKAGTVYAFDVHCRVDGGSCDPAWTAHVAEPFGLPVVASTGPIGTPRVFVGSRNGTYAFDLECGSGGATCTPLWHAAQPQIVSYQDDVLYGFDNGKAGLAYALDPETGKVLWSGGPGRCCSNSSMPHRYGDTVYVNFGHTLDAFPADCRGTCQPTWTAPITDAYSSQPVVAGDAVVVSVATNGDIGGVLSFPVDCATGGQTCTTSHRTLIDAEVTSVGPQVAGDRVYTESLRIGGVFVFDATCVATKTSCGPVWTDPSAGQPWEIVVDGGVAYEADGMEGLKAFDASCSADPCAQLWRSEQTPINRPIIANGEVMMTDSNGTIYAYAPGSAPASGSSGAAPILYGALLLIGIVVISVAVLRRRKT